MVTVVMVTSDVMAEKNKKTRYQCELFNVSFSGVREKAFAKKTPNFGGKNPLHFELQDDVERITSKIKPVI